MAGNQAQASESSYNIEIPDELGLGDELDFDAIEIADSDTEDGTTDEESPDEGAAPQPADAEPEGFLTDAELGKMGVTRDSPEHKALEAKFFPLWQDRLRRAGLTEAEIAARQAGTKAPAVEDTPPPVQQTQNTDDEAWVTWDDFTDPADLSGIADEPEAAVIRQSIREHVAHAVKSVMATSARKQQEAEAANVVKTWAESVKDNPALTPETVKAMQEFVAKPYAEQMWRDDPKGFTAVLAARFGLTPKAAAAETPAPTTAARRTPAPNATVTRARSVSTEAAPVKIGGSYEDIVKRTLGETFG